MVTLQGIARRQKKYAPMETVGESNVTCEAGIAGDFRGKPGGRQVTVLSAEAWKEVCDVVGESLVWTTRRANLLVSDISFSAELVGRQLKIGELILEITRETDPCSRMEDAKTGLLEALKPHWRGGVCCRVIQGGRIATGDSVELL